MLLLIHGAKRSGKDTFAGILKELVPESKVHSFADPLKEIISKTFSISLEVLDKLKNTEDLKIVFESPTEKYTTKLNMRNILQNFGTEGMKPIFGDAVWADLLKSKYDAYNNNDILVSVPDFRVPEEFGSLSKSSTSDIVTVKIERPGLESNDYHITENGLKDFKFDYIVLNDGTLDDLRAEAVAFLDYLQV